MSRALIIRVRTLTPVTGVLTRSIRFLVSYGELILPPLRELTLVERIETYYMLAGMIRYTRLLKLVS